MDYTYSITGFIVGILVGMTGVGGASILAPILIWMGIHPVTVIGTDLVYNSLTKLFGTIQHMRQRSVIKKLVLHLSLGSIPGAVLGVICLNWFNDTFHQMEWLIKLLLGSILIGTSVVSLWGEFRAHYYKQSKWKKKPVEEKMRFTIFAGFILGFIVGFTSIGSGSLFALVLYHLFSISGKELVGTDLAHAFLVVTAAGLVHLGLGNVEYGVVLQLMAGSIPGVILGSRFTAAIDTKTLRKIVLTTILISGMMLLLSN